MRKAGCAGEHGHRPSSQEVTCRVCARLSPCAEPVFPQWVSVLSQENSSWAPLHKQPEIAVLLGSRNRLFFFFVMETSILNGTYSIGLSLYR